MQTRIDGIALVQVIAVVGTVVSAGAAVGGCEAHSTGSERDRNERSERIESEESPSGGESRATGRRDVGRRDSGTATADTRTGNPGAGQQDRKSRRDGGPVGTMAACRAGRPDGEIELDFDGDGRSDTATLVSSTFDAGARLVLRVSLAVGDDYRLGAPGPPSVTRHFYGESGESEYRGGFGFVCSWGVRESSDGRITGSPAPLGSTGWEVDEALGDGLFVSGTDAAALVYLAEEGWVLMELGF